MRAEKQSILAELEKNVEGSSFFFLADYRGLTVAMLQNLRLALQPSKSRVQIVKNRLLKRVASELDGDKTKDCLSGPTALVFGPGDVVDAAKVLKTFIKTNKMPVLKAGMLEGRVITPMDITALADMPPKKDMQAKVVGTLAAPMSQLVGVMTQKMASLVYVLKAVQNKKESQA